MILIKAGLIVHKERKELYLILSLLNMPKKKFKKGKILKNN